MSSSAEQSKTRTTVPANPTLHDGTDLEQLADALRAVPFLAGLNLAAQANLLATAFMRRFEPDSVIMRQNEYGHSVFILLSGRVRIEVAQPGGAPFVLADLSAPGAYFGGREVLGRSRRVATAIAVAPSRLLEITKTQIERLDRDHGGIIEGLERSNQARSITAFLMQDPRFADLEKSKLEMFADFSRLEQHPRGSVIFEPGAPADDVLIIKSGVTKLEQAFGGEHRVLAYFSHGDVVGLSDEAVRTGTLRSMGQVEVIRTARRDFLLLEKIQYGFLQRFSSAHAAPATPLKVLTDGPAPAPNTIYSFVDDLVADGAQEAQSLLMIDLELCIRCGNCVRACEARHGQPKMTRVGKRLVRRQDQAQAGSYQNLLLPSSCRHCANPECMIGCPTGAIHRHPTGEVDITNACIGCANCATRCPWDNISMIPTPGRMLAGEEMKQIASKCNLCAGYENANCVDNCPTQAILRIEPHAYFPELREVLGQRDAGQQDRAVHDKVGGRRTRRGVPRAPIERALLLATVALLAAVVFLWWRGRDRMTVYHFEGVALGVLAFASMIGGNLLSLRRRLASRRRQLGAFHLWAKAHVYLGVVFTAAVLGHARGEFGGAVTTMLLGLVLFLATTGGLSRIIYRWLPKVITRLEGESQVREDAEEALDRLQTRIREFVRDHPDVGPKLMGFRVALPTAWDCLRRTYNGDAAREAAKAAMQAAPEVPGAHREALVLLHLDRVRIAELKVVRSMYRLRAGWLVFHVGLAAAVTALAVLHVASVLYFGGL